MGNWAKIKQYLSVALTDKEYWENVHNIRSEEPVYISGKIAIRFNRRIIIMVRDRMTNRKPLHWSHHIPLWYWVFVALLQRQLALQLFWSYVCHHNLKNRGTPLGREQEPSEFYINRSTPYSRLVAMSIYKSSKYVKNGKKLMSMKAYLANKKKS